MGGATFDSTYSQDLRTKFGGSYTLPDSTEVPPNKGLLSENTAYVTGQAGTRLGFSRAYDSEEAATALANWLSSLGNYLLWYRSSNRSVRALNISTLALATVIPGDLLGYSAVFANAGARMYAAFFATTGLGASGCRVISFQSGGFVQDLAFRPPITYVPSAPTEPGAGTVTAGTHYFGYRIEYRSGFFTRPSPDSGVGTPSVSTFTPVPFTASGGASLSWTLNTTWPTGAVNVYVMMTTVANPAQWFLVPGAVLPVIGGTLMSITFNFDISDDILFATGQPASDSLTLLTNTVVDTPPFFPSVVLTHGDRMAYVTTVSDNVGNLTGAVYMSNKQAFQELSADQSLIQLPGLLDITTAISLNGLFYMFGSSWTFETTDNGSAPATWAAAKLIDGERGTRAIGGAQVSPSGRYAWIAALDGLYYFQGSYGTTTPYGVSNTLPISYFQQNDWDRINWDAAVYTLQVRDDPGVKKVYVLAPLDGATTPNYLLTWDYTNGLTPDAVNYSLDSIQSYNAGAIEVVLNSLTGMADGVTGKKELWIGPSDEGPILRRNSPQDTDPYLDDGMPIFSNFETSLFPKTGTRGEVYQHHGADIRVKGSGQLAVTAYTLDHTESFACELIDLGEAPGEVVHRSYDLNSESVSLLFTQGQNLVVAPGFE